MWILTGLVFVFIIILVYILYLGLKPNIKILEIGSGWGGICFEIARQSECEVLGVTLSKNQLEYSRKKAKELKLDNQVTFELCDYREIKGKFDRVLNVGMLEHVHPNYYSTFFPWLERK